VGQPALARSGGIVRGSSRSSGVLLDGIANVRTSPGPSSAVRRRFRDDSEPEQRERQWEGMALAMPQ